MGRTNIIILCFGFGACIALSLMMKQVVQVKAKKDVHPALAELYLKFDIQLQERPKLTIEDRDGRKVAILTMIPFKVVGRDNVPGLAQRIGRYLGQRRDRELRFEALVIVAKSTTGGADRRFVIPVPRDGSSRVAWRSGAEQRKPTVPVESRGQANRPAPTAPPAPKTLR